MKIKQVFTKPINSMSIVHFVHSVNSRGVMKKVGKVGGVLFFLRANEKKLWHLLCSRGSCLRRLERLIERRQTL